MGNNSSVTGDDGIAIGQGAQAQGANSVAIGNTTISPNDDSIILGAFHNVGIGTNDPQAKLHVEGPNGSTLRIVDGNQANGKLLRSDADGDASWVTYTAANPIAFSEVYSTAIQTPVVNDAIAFDVNPVSDGIIFNADESLENTAVAGVYRVTYNINYQRNVATNSTIGFFIAVNGTGNANRVAGSRAYGYTRGNSAIGTVSKSFLVDLAQNSTVYIVPDRTRTQLNILSNSSFSMELVKAN